MIHETVFVTHDWHPIFWELSSEIVFQMLQKSLKLVHLLLWKQDSGDLKWALEDFRGLFYQMDHIW